MMHPVRRQRLYVVLIIAVFSTAAVGLVTYALRGNINLFYPPAEVVAGEAPVGQPIRVGGMVVEGSLQRAEDSLDAEQRCRRGTERTIHGADKIRIEGSAEVGL